MRFIDFLHWDLQPLNSCLILDPTNFSSHINGYARAYIVASQWRIETCFAQLGAYITLLHCNSTVTCFAFKDASLSRNCMVNVKCICTHCINVYVPIPACVLLLMRILQTHTIQLCCMLVGARSFSMTMYELFCFIYIVSRCARRFTDMKRILSQVICLVALIFRFWLPSVSTT